MKKIFGTEKQRDKSALLAAKFRDKLERMLLSAIKGNPSKGNLSVLSLNDIASLIAYCENIQLENYREAYNDQNGGFDTSVYESIPNTLYNLISKINGDS